jgi:hypothetical protein
MAAKINRAILLSSHCSLVRAWTRPAAMTTTMASQQTRCAVIGFLFHFQDGLVKELIRPSLPGSVKCMMSVGEHRYQRHFDTPNQYVMTAQDETLHKVDGRIVLS